jgi:hypothetical protein
VTGRFDLGPATIVEATYYGMFEWFDTAQVVSETGQLFSIFTKFGTDPFGGVGFEETDRANLHRLDYFSELHNAEINWRQYWVCDAPCVTGTWLMGARYVRVTEDFVFRTRVDGPPPSGMDYFVSTENDLVGFQIGGDSAACLLQGLRVVAEGKVGIYNNRAKQNTLVVATTLSPNRVEAADGDRVAFVGEGRVGVVADILPSWSLRAGYEVLYLNSIALAGNNFNPENPFVPGDRNVFLNDGGSALYHGAYGGLELVW